MLHFRFFNQLTNDHFIVVCIQLLGLYPQSSIAHCTFQRQPKERFGAFQRSFILCTTSISHPPSAATCDPGHLKQSTSSNGSPFSITCIRPPFPYLEHLITSLLSSYTLNFLFSHTLPNLLTSLRNFSESATSAVPSANNSWLISILPPFALSSSSLSQAP